MRDLVDVSDVEAFADELAEAALFAMPRIAPVMKKAGVNIKKAMKADATGHRHLRGLPRWVNFDFEQDANSVTVTVGFTKSGQGNLANIAAFGTVKNAPVMDITRGLRAEVPAVVDWLARVGVEVIR